MEVLLALLVAAILITVACAALITSLRAEERAALLRQERFMLQTAAARAWAGVAPDQPVPESGSPHEALYRHSRP